MPTSSSSAAPTMCTGIQADKWQVGQDWVPYSLLRGPPLVQMQRLQGYPQPSAMCQHVSMSQQQQHMQFLLLDPKHLHSAERSCTDCSYSLTSRSRRWCDSSSSLSTSVSTSRTLCLLYTNLLPGSKEVQLRQVSLWVSTKASVSGTPGV